MKGVWTMLSRGSAINSGIHAEEITSTAFNCLIERSNGYDLRTKNGNKVEVRSRIKFSDGKHPRLTLNRSKIEYSDIIVVVHYEINLEISIAIAINTKHLLSLYSDYLQKNGKAHLNWDKVANHSKAKDITANLIAADNNLKSKGFYVI